MIWNDPTARSAQEVSDAKEEREAEAYAEMYELVRAERKAAGKSDAPIMVCAEAKRRLRGK